MNSTQSKESSVSDILVIGAGPAGCSTALHASSLGLAVTLVEQHAIGGQARAIGRIDNLLGGPFVGKELGLKWRQQIEASPVHLAFGAVDEVSRFPSHWEARLCDERSFKARALVAATGSRECLLAEHPLVRGVPSVHKDRFLYQTYLVELACTQTVVIGCDRVLLSFLAEHGEQAAGLPMQVLALPDKWYVIADQLSAIPFPIIPVTSIENISRAGSTYQIDFVSSDGKRSSLRADLLITNLAKIPNSELFAAHAPRDKDGYLLSKDCLRDGTLTDFYAVGDVAHKNYQRITTAMGDGCYVALDLFYRLAQAPAAGRNV